MANEKLQETAVKLNEYAGALNGELNIEEAKKSIHLSEALTTNDANILIPKVVQQVTSDAAETQLIISEMFKRVNLESGRSMEFVHFGAIRAHEIAEGAEYPEESLNLTTQALGPVEVRVKKYGLRVAITNEMVEESQWDVVGLHIQAAGRALARKKEELAFRAFSMEGHTVFDGAQFQPGQDGYPTGRGFDGELNGTLTAEDMLDMAVSIMSAGFTPTTLIMHPLTWSLFAENEFIKNSTGTAAFGQGQVDAKTIKDANPSNSLGLEVIFSPFVPFNQAEKTFDFYIVDKNNVGVQLVKDDITTENFDDPYRDILNLKIMERYGLGVLHGGLGISVAKNIRFAKTYPAPARRFEAMPLPSDYKETSEPGEIHPKDKI